MIANRKIFIFLAAVAWALSTPAAIYWTETRFDGSGGYVMRANADGSGVTELVSGAATILGPNGLEYGNGALFWPDQQLNAVKRTALDGSTTLFATASNPYDVFISSDRVYWTSQERNYIASAKLDGTDPIQLLGRRSVTSPFAIEVTSSAIYWSEVTGSGTIRRSDLDGGNIVTLVTGVYVYDMQISGDFIYFGDNNFPAAMKRAKLDGTEMKTLFPVDFVNGIWLTKDFIYWSDLYALHRAGLDGSNPVILHAGDPSVAWMRGIVVLDDGGSTGSPQPIVGNPRLLGNSLVFTVQATPGKTVQIEQTTGFASWSSVASFVAGASPVNITNEIAGHIGAFRAKSN